MNDKIQGLPKEHQAAQPKPLLLHNLNCALLIPGGGPEDAQGKKQCSCGAVPQVPKTLDDVSGEEWNEAARSYVEKMASPRLPEVPPVNSGDVGAALTRWWVEKAEKEARELVPKAVEYGGAHRASDLTQLGRTLAELMEASDGREEDAELQELAIYFYLQGKMGRWQAALLEGRRVSDDTIHDLGIYVKMVQRIREAGGWPV